MKVRILNHDAYGVIGTDYGCYAEKFPVGSIHTVRKFFPDTGEIELGDEGDWHYSFAPSEYEVVEE